MSLSAFAVIVACWGGSMVELHNNSDVKDFIFYYIKLTRGYQPDLSGAVLFDPRHIVAPHWVLLVSFCRGPEISAWVKTHYMSPTLIFQITGTPDSKSTSPISSTLSTMSSSAAKRFMISVISTAFILLVERM